MPVLAAGTYPDYVAPYVKLVGADTVNEVIEKYSESIIYFFNNIPADKMDYRYAANKWSIKEVLQHVIDTERIFAYRALRISRKDKTALAGFDENDFVAASNAVNRSWASLMDEFVAVRKSTDLLLKSFTEEQLQQKGITNDQPNTTIAISFTIFGHALHHINIIKERYL